jgi:glyoxylate carboligase
MSPVSTAAISDRLAALRAELIEQAFALERQGRIDAADVALAVSHRIAEFCAELDPADRP